VANFGYYTGYNPNVTLELPSPFVSFSAAGSYTDPIYFFAPEGGTFTLYVVGKTYGGAEAYSVIQINILDCSLTSVQAAESLGYIITMNEGAGLYNFPPRVLAGLFTTIGGNTSYCVVD
jgi:hypothetical protein